MNFFLLGAIAMACFTVSLFFMRFWKTTRDRFFLFFAISFVIEGISRVMLSISEFADERAPFIYSLRLVSYLLILYAIIDKNWLRARKVPTLK